MIKTTIKVAIAVALLLLISNITFADDFTIDVSVSPAEARIGDEVTIVFTLTAMNANSLRIDPMDEEADEYAIIKQTLKQDLNLLGMPRLKRIVKLAPFEVGKLNIPTRVVEVINQAGNSTIGSSPMTTVNVLSVAPSEDGPEEVKELKGLMLFQEEDLTLAWIISITATLIAVALLLWLMFRSRMPSSLKELIKLTPAQRALDELNELRKSDMLKRGLAKSFYTRLSFILKRYMGLRYRLLSLEMTSNELSLEIKSLWKDSNASLEPLDQVLQVCDLAKFAKYVPEEKQGVGWVTSTRQMVLDTRDDIIDSSGNDLNEGGKEQDGN